MLPKNLLNGVGKMELLKKIIDLISQFLKQKEEEKIEKEEIKRVQIEQEQKTKKQVEKIKKETPKQPKPKDFFNDDNW